MSAAQDRADGPWRRASDLAGDFSWGRKVYDKIMHVFDYACVMRDFETGAMLLAVLENIAAREVRRFGGNRRRTDARLDAAAARLRSLQADSHCNGDHEQRPTVQPGMPL